MAETLSELLQRLLRDKFGGKKNAMAIALGLTASPLGRVIEGASKYFGPEACLRLAKVTGESASYVLKVAGKEDLAELIEELYGQQTISPADRQLLERWHALTPGTQTTVWDVINLATTTARRTEKTDEAVKPKRRTA